MVARKFLLVGVVVTLTGCSSTMYNQPAAPTTVYKPPTTSGSSPSSSTPAEKTVIKPPQESASLIRPGESNANRSSGAMTGLLDQGWAYYNDEDFELSISVAERAMRINRQDPEVYLLLSRSYLGLWQLPQAEQLARQGLALATRGSDIHAQLEDTMSDINRAR